MSKRVFLIVLLAAAVGLGQVACIDNLVAEEQTKFNINWLLDKLINNLQNVLATKHEPLNLPPYDLTFEYEVGLIVFIGQLRLDNSTLHNLSTIERTGDSDAQMENKTIHVTTELGIQDLTMNSTYTVKVINIGKIGQLIATVKNVTVFLDLDYDLNTFSAHLRDLQLESRGGIDIDLEGNFLDTLGTILVQTIASLFQGVILSSLESTLKEQIRELIE